MVVYTCITGVYFSHHRHCGIFTKHFIILDISPRRGVSSHQAGDVYPMLVQCWHTGYDVGPALKHYWLNVSCLRR